ncbi:hypothetical protein A2U01_0089126 [Trifolium medium]|uniref:Uncharacterized protein n=1 Tax=Trifolium medium TaxID=97028 RepID=A0A392U526_9FABA|nr:hypothetical protein [Trifolium medium]
MNEVHEVNRATYIRQRDAAGSSHVGASQGRFLGDLPRFDHDHNQPEND